MSRRSRKKNRNNIKNNIILIILISCLLYISIGYAFYTQDINIIGNVKIKMPTISSGDLTVTYTWTKQENWQMNNKYVYSILVTVTNNTNYIVNSWDVYIDFPSSAEFQGAWDCEQDKNNSNIFHNSHYNATINIGDSKTFTIIVALPADPEDLDTKGTSDQYDDKNTNTTTNTITPTISPTIDPTPTETASPTPTETPIISPTPTITPTATPTPVPEENVIFQYTDSSQGVTIKLLETLSWGSYSCNFTFNIYNTSTTPIQKWKLIFEIPNEVSTFKIWGANFTSNDSTATLGSGENVWEQHPIEPGECITINGQLITTDKEHLPTISSLTVEK